MDCQSAGSARNERMIRPVSCDSSLMFAIPAAEEQLIPSDEKRPGSVWQYGTIRVRWSGALKRSEALVRETTPSPRLGVLPLEPALPMTAIESIPRKSSKPWFHVAKRHRNALPETISEVCCPAGLA